MLLSFLFACQFNLLWYKKLFEKKSAEHSLTADAVLMLYIHPFLSHCHRAPWFFSLYCALIHQNPSHSAYKENFKNANRTVNGVCLFFNATQLESHFELKHTGIFSLTPISVYRTAYSAAIVHQLQYSRHNRTDGNVKVKIRVQWHHHSFFFFSLSMWQIKTRSVFGNKNVHTTN